MKITNLTLRNVRWPLSGSGNSTLGVVEITTDEGISGYSFLGTTWRGAQFDSPFLIEVAKPLVVDRDPLQIGGVWKDLFASRREVSMRAIGAVDVALWDIAGKRAGLPVHQLLGSVRSEVPVYGSTGGLAGPTEYAEEAHNYVIKGWQAYKIHPSRHPNTDIEIVRAVRTAVGSDMALMLDPVSGYSYEDALRVGLVLDELDFEWFEDPISDADLHGYRRLRDKINTPLMATEYAPAGFHGMQSWITQQATDMLRGDVTVKGGITPLIKITHLAEAFGMRCEIHHGGNALANIANLNVTMAISNCKYYEVIVNEPAYEFGVKSIPAVDERGMIHAPQMPGIGAPIDFDMLDNHTESIVD
jgi:L-alanine-DL-glutamate epimerase-like enolase superfamily enzyme